MRLAGQPPFTRSALAQPILTTPQVFEWVMCSNEAADSHRFMDTLDAAIKAKEVPSFAKFTAWAKRVAARPRPKPGPAAGKGGGRGRKAGKGSSGGDEAALVAAIRGRQSSALARMGGGGGVLGALMRRMGGDIENIPSEEDFLAARARLEGKQTASGRKQKAAGASSGRKAAGGSDSKQKAAVSGGAGSPSKRAKKG